MVSSFSDGLSGSGESLRSGNVIGENGEPTENDFDATRAPNKDLLIAAHYQYTAYYGKISLSRDTIMNLSLSGLIGGGVYLLDGLVAPTFNFGVSQRYYFSSRVALRFDILFSIFNGPDITSAGLLPANGQPGPDPSEFESNIQFDSTIFLGLSFLI